MKTLLVTGESARYGLNPTIWSFFVVIDADANASYLPSERLQGVIARSWGLLGNPSSVHRSGQRARATIEEARLAIRDLVGAASSDQVILTSGATEANNLIVSQVRSNRGGVVSSAIEHPCVLQPLAALQREGLNVHLVMPNRDGSSSPEMVEGAVDRGTRLVSIMAANNETGVINNVTEIARSIRAKAPEVTIHSDVAQIIGKVSFSFKDSALDAVTISGHKFGALTGVGALIVRQQLAITPQILGGPQEQKLRGGTENVLGIISLGEAAREVMSDSSARTQSMLAIRNRFERELTSKIPEISINGISTERLPNTSSVAISGVRADDLVVALDCEGILISSGAACSSGKPEPSHVLRAMGQTEEEVHSTIRVSFRADQPPELATQLVEVMARVVARIRNVEYHAMRV